MSSSKAGPDGRQDVDGIKIEGPTDQDRRECVTSDALQPLAWPSISVEPRKSDLSSIANHHPTHGFKILIRTPLGRSCFWPICSLSHPTTTSSSSLHHAVLHAPAQSRAFTIYDLVNISILHLDIPASADDNLYFPVTFSQGSRTPFLQGHISNVPWPRSPSRSPSPASSDIRPPSGLGRRASIISELDVTCTDSPVSPTFPRMSEMFPSVPTYIVPPSARSSFQTHPTRARTLSSPAFLHSLTESMQAPPPPPQRIIVTSPQLALYRTLELSADDADACIARLAGAPHLAALVTTLTLRAYPSAHGPSFILALALALRSMRAVSALTLPAFDAELLAAAPGTLTHLTLLADTLPYAFFDGFLAAPARARLTHLALPHFVGVPPASQDVPSAAVPRLAVLDSSPGLAAALAPGRPLRRVTLHIASTLYDGLRPAALFGALGGALKELGLVLAPDVDVRTRGRLLGALGNTGAGLEVLELSLDGTSDEVSLQALYKQVGSLLPNVQALRTLRLRTSLPTEAAKAEEGPSRFALWTRPPLGSALRCVFASGAHWELERGEWSHSLRLYLFLCRYNATDCIPARLVHHENAEEYAGAKGTDSRDRDRVVGIVVRRKDRLALRIVPAHVLLDQSAAAPSWVEGPDNTVAHAWFVVVEKVTRVVEGDVVELTVSDNSELA
ncbi:hypothetical protein EDB83DRAFT_2556922 [Lactarius deliciosus]|nr:hypothetical protein EDB83DRAFT_2556922 [Lactarius deliciosus]